MLGAILVDRRDPGVKSDSHTLFIALTQGIDTDASNPASRLLLNLLAAFAEFERELIVERTKAGLQRARKEGRIGGRPRLFVRRDQIRESVAAGVPMRQIAAEHGISAASVCRIVASS